MAAARQTGVPVSSAVAVAVGLALLAVIPVAGSLLVEPSPTTLANSGFAQGPIDWQPISLPAALALALVVVLIAALVGGSLGGLVWRWRRFAGAVGALVTAWATGIVMLPLAAAALGIHLRAGIVCVMGCESLLRDDKPFGGAKAYGEFVVGTLAILWAFVWPGLLILFAVFVLPWWIRGRAAPRPRLPLTIAIAAFAAVHGFPLLWAAPTGHGGTVPYVCLSLGVVAWTVWMARGSRAPIKALVAS
jgi:hypothetical protein